MKRFYEFVIVVVVFLMFYLGYKDVTTWLERGDRIRALEQETLILSNEIDGLMMYIERLNSKHDRDVYFIDKGLDAYGFEIEWEEGDEP